MNEFESKINSLPPLPNPYKPFPISKEYSPDIYGKHKELYETSFVNLLIFFSIISMIALLVIAGFFVYGVFKDKLKPEQEINSFFNQTTNNNYNFTNDDRDEYNQEFKLYANITIQGGNCPQNSS